MALFQIQTCAEQGHQPLLSVSVTFPHPFQDHKHMPIQLPTPHNIPLLSLCVLRAEVVGNFSPSIIVLFTCFSYERELRVLMAGFSFLSIRALTIFSVAIHLVLRVDMHSCYA